MKILSTIIFVAVSFCMTAQITIKEQNVDVNGTNNGYQITIPYGENKSISKELKSELKSWKGKVSNKDFFFADDCKLKEIGKNTFDTYAKVEDITKGGVTVYVKVNLGGIYLNSKDHPGEFKIIEKKLYDFAVKAAKSIIEDEAKAEEKVMKGQESDLDDIKKEIDKQENAIVAADRAIEAAKEEIKKGGEAKQKKEAEIKATAVKIEAIRAKKEAVK